MGGCRGLVYSEFEAIDRFYSLKRINPRKKPLLSVVFQ
jgi:hypothetical protein